MNPSPKSNFSEKPEKILAFCWDRTQYRHVTPSNYCQPLYPTSHHMLDMNIVLVYGFVVPALDKNLDFFPRRHPFVFLDGNRERVLIWEHSHYITLFFLFSLLILPTFYFRFINIEVISCLEKGSIIWETFLFSFY